MGHKDGCYGKFARSDWNLFVHFPQKHEFWTLTFYNFCFMGQMMTKFCIVVSWVKMKDCVKNESDLFFPAKT